jgi:hypothetical protein
MILIPLAEYVVIGFGEEEEEEEERNNMDLGLCDRAPKGPRLCRWWA